MKIYKKNIWIIILLSILSPLRAQIPDLYMSLYQPPWKGNNEILDSILEKYNSQDSIYYRIPLTIWIYPNKKGFGPGFNEVKNIIRDLNFYSSLNNIGVEFYLANLKIVPSQSHQEVGYFFENLLLTSTHHIKGNINIHLVNNIKINFIFINEELGGTYNNITKSILLTRDNIPSGIAHEIGHYFGLLHPHRNWNKGRLWAEAVSRTRTIGNSKIRNCEARGDFLCDTPAEPNLSKFMNDSCKYIGNITDPWGEPYKPATDNIMSYQPNKKCRKKFTPYQKAVILYSIEHSKYSRYWRNSLENISFTPDKYEPDDYIQIATLLEPYTSQYHTFNLKFSASKNISDKIDFFKFYPSSKNKYYLSLKKGNYPFTPVKITIYDNFYTPLLTKFLYDPGQISLPRTDSPVLYLKVENISDIKQGQLFDYCIELLEF